MNSAFLGGVINSAVYLLCVCAAGLATQHSLAWKGAILSIALTFLSYVADFHMAPQRVRVSLMWASIVMGTGAGLALLF